MRDLEYLWKTGDSAGGECPSLFKVDGGYITVGRALTTDELAQVDTLGRANNAGIGEGETAVFLPDDVLDRLRG